MLLSQASYGSRKESVSRRKVSCFALLIRKELVVFKPVCSLSQYDTGDATEDFYPILNHLPCLPKPVLFYRTGKLSLHVCIAQTTWVCISPYPKCSLKYHSH